MHDLEAGFAEADITPRRLPVRIYYGRTETVHDPIHAKAAVFAAGGVKAVLVAFDVVIIEAQDAGRFRHAVSGALGVSERHVMVCATHNHACPAVIERPGSAKDEAYIAFMLEQGVQAVLEADRRRQPVELGAGAGFETRLSFVRRFVARDGTVVTQPAIEQAPDMLCHESVIDPEVGILAVRNRADRRIAGVLVNFGSHATHGMGRHISAGFPGVLDQSLKDALGPQCVTLFSNGGGGNVQHMEYLTPEPRHKPDMDAIGRALAEHVDRALPAMVFSPAPRLAVREVTVALRYREGLEDLAAHAEDPGYFPGILGGLIERGWYAWSVEQLRAAHAAGSGVDVPVQAIGVGPAALVGIPAEYFSDSVLAIKARSPIRHTWMLSTTNGWLGYVPAPAAFARRGGHESTLAWWSKMAPETGDRLADAALESLRGLEAAHSGARADAGSQPPSAPAP